MKHLTAVIKMPKELAPILQKALNECNPTLKRDAILWESTASFRDGCFALFQVIAPGRPEEEPCWAQFVLFSPDGHEMAVSDVLEDAGEEPWVVEVDGTEYSAALLPV